MRGRTAAFRGLVSGREFIGTVDSSREISRETTATSDFSPQISDLSPYFRDLSRKFSDLSDHIRDLAEEISDLHAVFSDLFRKASHALREISREIREISRGLLLVRDLFWGTADTERRRGVYKNLTLPWTPGTEGAGRVVAVGPETDAALLDRRVAFWAMPPAVSGTRAAGPVAMSICPMANQRCHVPD